jgi:hypothetical protein
MICRLVISLRKATDPKAIRAWNVDHFSTLLETRIQTRHNWDGIHLSPIRLHPPTVSGSERGTESEGDGLVGLVVSRSPADSGSNSRRWTIDGPEDEAGCMLGPRERR